jgi:tRNA/rRNA methyltransferase
MNACRVVLVRTEVAANIGAAARVMRNMGAADLVLVAPRADHLSAGAEQLATHHGAEVLRRARVVPDLDAALADGVLAAATSARTGGLFRRQTVGPPEEVAPALAAAMAAGPVALVFGPEPHGLTNEELVRCGWQIHIPADEAYPALNLAQAVAVCLYELRRAWLAVGRAPAPRAVAAHVEQERMFARLEEALRQVRYLRGVRGDALMHALRHLIGRALPSPMEVRLLLGLARQLRWVARRAGLEEEEEDLTQRRKDAKKIENDIKEQD